MSQERKEQADQIAEEHAHIRQRLGELETTTSVDSLRAQLTALVPILRDHFAVEEDLAEFERENPGCNLAGLVKVLGEHPRILSQADALIAACASGADNGQLREQVAEFVDLIRGHEQRETKALMDAMWTDIGGQS
jgi:hypothetical protein